MTFINFFTNINIGNYCSEFDRIIPPYLENCSFMNNLEFNNFNFSMPIFNNFSCQNDFTNYLSSNNMPTTSLWNINSTNIQIPNFNNSDRNASNLDNWNYNFTTPSLNSSNYDTFNNSTDTIKNTTSISEKIPSNYDKYKGKRLADIALKNQKGFSGNCATYVKKAIQEAGLGSYTTGDAYQMSSILRRNSNFKEISVSSVNVKDLPAGCILVYDKGAQNYSARYGHTEITTGDGRAVSDGITKNLHKMPSAIFVPVTA